MTVLARVQYLTHGFAEFAAELLRSRRLIFELTRRELRSRYLGSAFGLAWAFIHPAVMMLVYFLVFKYGLKAGPVAGVPFIVDLLSKLVPWFIISDAMTGGSNVILDNRFLVKKVVFRVSLLPVVRLLTFLPVHLFFLVVITLMFWGYGYPPGWQSIQVFYYLFAILLLGVGWTWLVSAMVPFFKDLSQVVGVLSFLAFWGSAIVWPAENIGPRWHWLMDLNPLYYIVHGYQESLISHVWFWHHPLVTPYFWAFTLLMLAAGGSVFLRLRSHFADVL